MPKTRNAKNKGGDGGRPQYREDSSDDENMFNIGRLRTFFDFLVQHNSPNRKRKSSAGRGGSKRKTSLPTDDNTSDCSRCHRHRRSPKKRPTKKSAASKTQMKECCASTSTATNIDLVDSDSGDEINPVVTESHKDSITKKVDTFFQRFESDDDDYDSKRAKPATMAEKKSKEFYTFNSDTEEEQENTQKVPNEPVTSKPSTSSVPISNIVTTGLKLLTSAPSLNSDKKVQDIFAYVDEVMKECDEVFVLEDDKPKENIPELSLTDLKKKTAEILANVETEAKNLKDIFDLKAKETEKNTVEPTKDAPCCPVCLEQLGGGRQAMSTLCGHMFCEPCLQQVIKSTKSCPSCRKRLTKKSMYHPIYI
ncbi:uncharacterized protein LOC126742674 isoform X2 [Anthonomus grandis grandis]|nr:uncharacterized protein LOC126742674 isoform X2 [Anthonomus grandis grandis]XP_050305379.1 uncharacterized protein LOC126742674 isoform X2 [Anthonomus grandis grandis]